MSSGFLLNGSTGFVGGAIARLAHAADERIPVEALEFGT